MADLKLCTQRSVRIMPAGWYDADVRCLIPFLLGTSETLQNETVARCHSLTSMAHHI